MQYFTILLMWSACAVSSVHCKAAYKIKINRAEVVRADKQFAEGRFWMTKPDRYTNAVNGAFAVYNVPKDTKVKLKMYEFFSNEYRPYAINLEQRLCRFMELGYKMIFYPDFIRLGADMPEPRCPVKPGNYSFANFTPDIENYPPGLPFRNWLLMVEFWNGSVEIAVVKFYGILDRDAVIREQYG